jgi:hypothetical protein
LIKSGNPSRQSRVFCPVCLCFALLHLASLEPYCKKIAVARNTFWQKREPKVERFHPFPTFKAKQLLVNGSISFRFNVVLLIIEESLSRERGSNEGRRSCSEFEAGCSAFPKFVIMVTNGECEHCCYTWC